MTETTSNGDRRRKRHSRRPVHAAVAVAALLALFGVALLVPMPAFPNAARAEVVSTVNDRLPGWKIVRARASWEGGWSVVAACGSLQLGFQLVPGHGLSPGDAWLHPEDLYAHDRLSTISDDGRFLVWFSEPIRPKALSCRQELARVGPRARGLLD